MLTALDVSENSIGPQGAEAIGEALTVNEAVLTSIDLRRNNLGDKGKKAIQDAVSGREGFKLEM